MLTATKRFIKWLAGAALVIAFLIFSVNNRQNVTISVFPLLKAEMPLFLFTILCFALGAVTGGVIVSFGSLQTRWQHKKAKRRMAALENEVKALHAQQEEKPPAIPHP